MCIPERNYGGIERVQVCQLCCGGQECHLLGETPRIVTCSCGEKQQYQNLSIIGNKMFM